VRRPRSRTLPRTDPGLALGARRPDARHRDQEDGHLCGWRRGVGVKVARATDRRFSDLTLVRVSKDSGEVSAVYDTPDGSRFVIRATGDAHLISRVQDPAR
jgi:hypothetical protein